MRKPIKPLPMDCCGSGCARCVHDIYEEHLQKYNAWKQQQKAGKASETEKPNSK